jgi:hypothetical protein
MDGSMTKLTVVIVGRNDDHGGDFRERLFAAMHHNVVLLRDACIDFEYLWVEWNPVPGKPLLAAEILAALPDARAIVVEPDVHDAYCENPNMPIMEFIAKNVGIRRAAGDWVLTTNADIVFGRDVIAAVANLADVSQTVIYRAVRHDLDKGVRPEEAEDRRHWVCSHPTNPPYHAEGSGDFIMASKIGFEALRGFNETIRFAKIHKDTQFCVHAGLLHFDLVPIGNVYHLYHWNSWMTLPPEKRIAPDAPWGPSYQHLKNLPYLNPANWGLADYAEAPLADRLWRLVPALTTTIDAPLAHSDTNLLREAERAWRLGRTVPLDRFRGEYTTGFGRLVRKRCDETEGIPDPPKEAVALLLRRYMQAVWASLLADPRCREKGVALYGAGCHTRWLLEVLRDVPGPVLRCVLDDRVPPEGQVAGVPVVQPASIDPSSLGAVVLSSDAHEPALAARCAAVFGSALRVVRLYDGLPPEGFAYFKFYPFVRAESPQENA